MNMWEFFDSYFWWFISYAWAVWLIPALYVLSKFPASEDKEDE